MLDIADNLNSVRARIRNVEQRYGRAAGSVELLAVSKTKPASMVQEAINAGQTEFGENYVQEAVEKINALAQTALQWHFIGPIQSNKTRLLAENFSWVQSVGRLKIAQRLSDQRPAALPALNICLQVNISDEASKSGLKPDELASTVESVVKLPRIVLRGLMAIPAKHSEFEKQRQPFKLMRECLQDLNRQFDLQMDTLSMGMSSDLEAAIAEGATIVRVGTDVFGAREYKV